ncbi:MAG: YWFCY domain-containing protein [Cytophagales bacterium]|jgi:hypothetical protein|nr:YWFCY domain-containing protein [Cytophagales bacterium]
MGNQTGENEQTLRKILDMTRLMGIVVLALHFYYFCHQAFQAWGLTMAFTDRLLTNVQRTYLNDVMEQPEGQIASAKVAMARLASPQLYYGLR